MSTRRGSDTAGTRIQGCLSTPDRAEEASYDPPCHRSTETLDVHVAALGGRSREDQRIGAWWPTGQRAIEPGQLRALKLNASECHVIHIRDCSHGCRGSGYTVS